MYIEMKNWFKKPASNEYRNQQVSMDTVACNVPRLLATDFFVYIDYFPISLVFLPEILFGSQLLFSKENGLE